MKQRDAAIVEFTGGQAQRMHKISQFVPEDERWLFDGGMLASQPG